MNSPETARLNNDSDRFRSDFVDREATPEPKMNLSIRIYLAGRSLLDTVFTLDRLSVTRCRLIVYNWVQNADLQLLDETNLEHVAVDETVIQNQ